MKEKILAHRGVSRRAPENTLAAFKKALDLGLGGIELDIQMSKDGHVIVLHDEKVDRTTDGKGFIKDMTLEDIKKLDAGSWFGDEFIGEKVLLLEEVLEFIGDRGFIINIELKSGIIQYAGLEDRVLDIVKHYNFLDRTIFSSFNHYSLVNIKEKCSNAKIGLLYYAGLVDPWEFGMKLDAYSLNPFFTSVTEQMVKRCLEVGLQVIPFTVNDNIFAKRLVEWGVEYIITDIPDKIITS
ncbi:MAG: hypothetical protein APF76_03185 [Desulfitibacter sp. BRH_c19]|nr:MAG: hypothetical protein APF76_03185 [Desulfitibacter sp. BRH_c19]